MRVVGLAAAFNQLANGIAAGQVEAAQRGLITPFTDMIFFPMFFGAEIAFRRRPEIHKRLMLLATVMLLVAAVLRIRVGMPAFLSIWLAPVFIAMIYDYASRRVIHPVYVIGLVVLTVIGFSGQLSGTDARMSIARSLPRLAS